MSSFCLSKLSWGILPPGVWFRSVVFCFYFPFDRKKKPHCTVLLGMATTLLPKHSVKQVAMWTLKTKKGRLRSWQLLLGVTTILSNAWRNTGLTLMQQTRLVWFGFDHKLHPEIIGVTEPYLWIASFGCCKPALFPWCGFSEQFTQRLFMTPVSLYNCPRIILPHLGFCWFITTLSIITLWVTLYENVRNIGFCNWQQTINFKEKG